VHALLQAEGWNVNVKRIRRLWILEQLKVPARKAKDIGKKADGHDANSAWALPAIRPNHVWSYDFVSARTDDGGPLRILNVVDEIHPPEQGQLCRALDRRRAGQTLPGSPVRPARQAGDHPPPQRPRVHLRDGHTWLTQQGVSAAFIAKASPQPNCYVERFNGTMRDELLNRELFHTCSRPAS
jgi:putative transposase